LRNTGHTASSAAMPGSCGTFRSNTMIVMATASTPSLNASSLPLPMPRLSIVLAIMPPPSRDANRMATTIRSCVRRALLGALLAASLAAHAATLRVASAFDPQTMDPHALALLYHSRVVFQLYDSLVSRDEHFRLEPALAESWQMVGPTTWRFKLRRGVKFHDGSTFGADDALFS